MHALIMAGGRSERMRARGGPLHKALKPVLGVPLLERNVLRLLSRGLHHLTIAINYAEIELAAFIDERIFPLIDCFGAHLSIIKENQGLGNIGAARLVDTDEDLLVVYVDNLCAVEIGEMYAHHQSTRAELSIATREYTLKNPFGELQIEGDYVVSYREKPSYTSTVSSGTCILSPGARKFIPRDEPCDAVRLFALLRAENKPIAAYRSERHWIDINDVEALGSAEKLVREYHQHFEHFPGEPDLHVLVAENGEEGGIFAYLHSGNEREPASSEEIPSDASFDAIELPTGICIRYHLIGRQHHRGDHIISPKGHLWQTAIDLSANPQVTQRINAWIGKIPLR